MFLVSGKRKFLLDFDSVGAQDGWLNMRLILIDGDKKFEAVEPVLQLNEFSELSKWFVSVIERPFKDIAKTKFTKPELSFEFSPEKFDIERGSFLRVTFTGAFFPDFMDKDAGTGSYVFEGYFPRPQLINFLRHLKAEYHSVRSACEGQPYPPDSPGRKFREFLFYNYEKSEYEYLHDNFFLDEVEKNLDSIEKSYQLIKQDGQVGENNPSDQVNQNSLNFISVVASQRTNLFEEPLSKLLTVAAIPYPAWYMIYDVLGKTAIYYKLYAPAVRIFTQGMKTAKNLGDEVHFSEYQSYFEKALAGFVELCKDSFKAAGIDSLSQNVLTSMLPLAFYLYSEHGAAVFDKMGTFQLIHESVVHRSTSEDKYVLTVGCGILCAILIQLIIGNPLFNDCLEIVQKQMRKFIRAYQQIFPQDSSGYSTAFEKFSNIFSKDFANSGKKEQPEVFDLLSFMDSDMSDFSVMDGTSDDDGENDSLASITSSESKTVSALEIAIWCNLNFQDFEECVSTANKMVQNEEFADEDAVAVTKIIAFFANGGEAVAKNQDPDEKEGDSWQTSSDNKTKYSESIARIVESNLRRFIQL